jgi:hypothetical protein
MSDLLRDIATPTAQQVLEARRLRGELSTPQLDSRNLRLYGLPSAVVRREAFAADRQPVADSFQGETPRFLSER